MGFLTAVILRTGFDFFTDAFLVAFLRAIRFNNKGYPNRFEILELLPMLWAKILARQVISNRFNETLTE